MHDIDPSVARTFFRENSPAELQAATLTRLTEIYPLMNIDSHFFYPQGYSLNGISSKNYYTVHVTPQSEASYVSFESNIIDHDSPKVVEKVVSVFNPKRYSLVFKTTNDGLYADFHRTLVANQPGYQTMDQMRHKFDGHYTASFSNFLKQRH
jgi:S-adenosylmethionine decarboxylase